jgi:capsule polysaccharide export protein KpsE/RkpR
LRVTKLKDTKVLRISVTLEDPKQAHQLARYIAEETVALNRSMARDADRELLGDLESEMGAVRARLDQAQAEYNQAAAGGQERILDEELRTLADLKSRTSVEWLEAKAEVAELAAKREQPDLSATEARLQMLTAEQARLDAAIAAHSAKLAAVRARQDRAGEALRVAEAGFDAWSRRTTELAAATGTRAEQLRVVDPGIVPQRPSFPNLPLFVIAAVIVSAVLCTGILTLRFGLERVRASAAEIPAPSQIRVARGGRG